MNEKEVFERFYSKQGKVRVISLIKSSNVNSKNWVVDNKYVLRRFNHTDIELGLKVMDFCFNEKFLVPKIVKSDNGNIKESAEGEVYSCFSYVKNTGFNGARSEIISAGEVLAGFHKVMENFKGKLRYDEYNLLTLAELTHISDRIGDDKFDLVVRNNLEYISKKIQEINCVEELDLPKQIIHGDYHKDNVLFEDGRVVAVIDFDSVKISERIKEVGFSALRFCKNKKEIGVFMDAYNKISKLSDEEMIMIRYLSIKESLRRISKILRLHYLEGDDKWSFDFEKHIKNIKLAELVLDDNKAKPLKDNAIF